MAKKKDEAEDGDEGGKGGGSKLKLIAMVLPTVLLVLGAVYFLVLAPKGSSTTTKTGTAAAAAASASDSSDAQASDVTDPAIQATFTAGKVASVDAVTVNLANGHFLKVGLGLQETADVSEDVSPAPAIDCIITEFSGKTVDELATQQGRDAAKKALTNMVYKVYDKKVYKIFYNSFVMN